MFVLSKIFWATPFFCCFHYHIYYHITNVHYFTATCKFKMNFNNLTMFRREY